MIGNRRPSLKVTPVTKVTLESNAFSGPVRAASAIPSSRERPINASHYVHRVAYDSPRLSHGPLVKTWTGNNLTKVFVLAAWVHFSGHAPAFAGKDGAPLDDFIWDSRIRRSEAFRGTRRTPETWLAAASDRAVPDLLRADDHAHRGAGADDRIAADADSRALRRQRAIVCPEDEGPGGSGAIGFEPGPGCTSPVCPEAVSSELFVPDSFSPEPVDPGSSKAGPVFPGGTS